MRLIGHLPSEASATTFSDYLYVLGIANEVEAEKEGWAVWIHSEDELSKATDMLKEFLGDPGAPKFRKEAGRARELKQKTADKEQEIEDRVVDRAKVFRASMPYGVGPLTMILLGLCMVVQVLAVGGFEEGVLRELFMTAVERNGQYFRAAPGLPEILEGQVWRLFTPILVHSGWVHLLFNMMCLLGLGSMIEGRESTGKLGLMVIVLAVGSNLGQYILSGPIFCGMSGVVYGLLGYIWMRGKFDPTSGLFLHPQTVGMMLFWFFLCLASVIPGIGEGIIAMVGMVANGCHAAGLAMGVTWGFLASVPAIRRGA